MYWKINNAERFLKSMQFYLSYSSVDYNNYYLDGLLL